MNERRWNLLTGVAACIALSMPVPAIAQGRSIVVGNCLGGMIRNDIPPDPNAPSDHDCCKKGCHAAGDRRKKGKGVQEDGCC